MLAILQESGKADNRPKNMEVDAFLRFVCQCVNVSFGYMAAYSSLFLPYSLLEAFNSGSVHFT